jgi:hypothetical protein
MNLISLASLNLQTRLVSSRGFSTSQFADDSLMLFSSFPCIKRAGPPKSSPIITATFD